MQYVPLSKYITNDQKHSTHFRVLSPMLVALCRNNHITFTQHCWPRGDYLQTSKMFSSDINSSRQRRLIWYDIIRHIFYKNMFFWCLIIVISTTTKSWEWFFEQTAEHLVIFYKQGACSCLWNRFLLSTKFDVIIILNRIRLQTPTKKTKKMVFQSISVAVFL